jgi:hypothetical protein
MTQEQDAANWQSLTQYKQLREEKSKREALAQSWGNTLVSVGEPLATCGGMIVSLDLARLPDRAAMIETAQELRLLNDQLAALRRDLHRAGMSDLT